MIVTIPAPVGLDDKSGSREGGARDPSVVAREDVAPADPNPDRAIRCRRCDQAVGSHAQVFAFRAARAVQVFPNPSGQMMKILTIRATHHLTAVSVPTTAFTWFDGYAWTVMVCARCGLHLGWQYDVVGTGTPGRFYGLRVDSISE